jgi:hypothetical protein
MRIYINTLCIQKFPKMETYTKCETTYRMLFSEMGIFRVDNKDDIYRCFDEFRHNTESVQFGGHSLLLDNTKYKEEKVLSQLPVKYISTEINRTSYYKHVKSPLKIVIERSNMTNCPAQIYFETDGKIDDMFVKKEIEDFLSLV